MVDISFNHLALVAEPRVTTAIIGDSLPKGMKVTNGYPLQNRSVSQILEELAAAPQEITPSAAMDGLVSQRFAERQERERKAFSEQFPEVSRIQVKG